MIQQDAAKYLINDKSNFIELQLANIKYDFEKVFEDHKFGTISSESQYDKDNVKIANPNFLPFNYKANGKSDTIHFMEKRRASDVEPIVEQSIFLKDKVHSAKQIFSEDEVIFRKKLKKILKKADSVLKEKQRSDRLKQSKKINEIARKLDEFIQKKQLDKKPQAVEKVYGYESVDNKVENITDSKFAEHLVPYRSMKQHKFDCMPRVANSTFAKLPNPISHVQKITESTALVLYKVDDQIRGKEKNIAQIKLVYEALPYNLASLLSPTEGLDLVVYKKADEICVSNDKFTVLIPYVHQHCLTSFTYSRNISSQETTPYILSETLGRKFNEYANPICVESDEPLSNPPYTLGEKQKNFMMTNLSDWKEDKQDDESGDRGDGGGGGIPPQPPGGFGILAIPYSGSSSIAVSDFTQ